MNKLNLCLFLSFCLISLKVLAYPEMIRHGYTSCTACHVSPAGGGLVTTYGRVLSKELLSRWSYEGEEQIFHGALDESIAEWVNGSKERGFNVGGSFRYIQTRVETDAFSAGQRFAMQRDLEVAAKWDDFSLVTSYGAIYNPRAEDEIELRRMYLMWNATDNIILRAGRFIPNYGIMFSDHYLSIKSNLQLAQFSERDTLEAHFIYEKWSGSLSYSKAPSSKRQLQQEESVVGTLNYNITNTMRVGVNYWFGDLLGRKRDTTGLNALLGFNKKLYSLIEVDFQTSSPDVGIETEGIHYFYRLGYEAINGLHFLAQLDAGQNNLDDSATKFHAFGGGINFYPRPHFELQFMWTRPKFSGQSFTDSGFFIFHYYL